MVRIDTVRASMMRAVAVAAPLSAIGSGAALAQGAPPGSSSWKTAQGAPPGSSSWKTASAESTKAVAMKEKGVPVASNPPTYYG
jgi:hypothetical protein